MLASATIGPAGGTVAVASGTQAGLELRIPAGALREPTVVRIRDLEGVPARQPEPQSVPLGLPFQIEPDQLRLDEMAVLRAPYAPGLVAGTSPTNVRMRQVRSSAVIDHVPDAVDVVDGWVEVEVRELARFQAVQGPAAASIQGYWPTDPDPVLLSGDVVMTAEPVPATSPFAGEQAYRWRIRGPDFEDVLYFDGTSLRARESVPQDWRERWVQPWPVWDSPATELPATFATDVEVVRPIGGPATLGAMVAFGRWSWSLPRFVVDRTLFDVVQLQMNLAWNRADLGVGQREYVFWFAPGIGLLGLRQDGVLHERLVF